LKPTIVAVIGGKRSGKTTTIEALTRELTKRGYNVATVKHVSEVDFTIDTKGKDTWRFASAGARKIVAVASNEIATIEKTNAQNITLAQIIKRCRDADIVLLEGFRKLVIKNHKIPKIVAVKTLDEANEFTKNFKNILAFTGAYSTEKIMPKTPHVDALKNPEKLADLVEKIV